MSRGRLKDVLSISGSTLAKCKKAKKCFLQISLRGFEQHLVYAHLIHSIIVCTIILEYIRIVGNDISTPMCDINTNRVVELVCHFLCYNSPSLFISGIRPSLSVQNEVGAFCINGRARESKIVEFKKTNDRANRRPRAYNINTQFE